MRTLILVLCALLFASEAQGKTYVIKGDGGGSVYDYGRRWDALRNDRIIVDGACYSSCTMVLSNLHVCATEKAEFGFHPAYVRILWVGPYIIDKAATDYMKSRIPADVLNLIPPHHWTAPGGIFVPPLYRLKASQLPSRYLCKG